MEIRPSEFNTSVNFQGLKAGDKIFCHIVSAGTQENQYSVFISKNIQSSSAEVIIKNNCEGIYTAEIHDEVKAGDSFKAQVINTKPLELIVLNSYRVPPQNVYGNMPFLTAGSIRLIPVNLEAKEGLGVDYGRTVNFNVTVKDGNIVLESGGKLFYAEGFSDLSLSAGKFSITAKIDGDFTISSAYEQNRANFIIKNMLLELMGKGFDKMAILSGAVRMDIPSAEQLASIINNSGIFFENKLLTGKRLEKDAKYLALKSGNIEKASDITLLQAASISLSSGILAFFSSESLSEEARIRIKKEDYGVSVYFYLNFSITGKTLISIVPKPAGGYAALVRTESDAGKTVEKLNIKNLDIKWKKITEKDIQLFEELLSPKSPRFDIFA